MQCTGLNSSDWQNSFNAAQRHVRRYVQRHLYMVTGKASPSAGIRAVDMANGGLWRAVSVPISVIIATSAIYFRLRRNRRKSRLHIMQYAVLNTVVLGHGKSLSFRSHKRCGHGGWWNVKGRACTYVQCWERSLIKWFQIKNQNHTQKVI